MKNKIDSILERYKCKARILIVRTPNYKNKLYLKTKEYYDKNAYEFHKSYVKKISVLDKSINDLKLELYDLNKKLIISNQPIPKIFTFIKKYDNKTNCKEKPLNLSLYTDYNPETTIPNLGFKNKEKALYTIDKIKDKPIKYQIGVLNTLLGRAKSHPHQTKEMRDAIKILEEYKNKIFK
tara:strand:- start:1057 stop:1596 length:540 start_codon:yes stop_codon:yes gene_type:complete